MAVFKCIFLLSRQRYKRHNDEIWIVDAETSFKEDYGLKSENFYNMQQFLIALPESIFRPTIMIFKILKGVKQSTPNTASHNGWIFRYIKSRLRYGTKYLYCFSIYHRLIFGKRLVSKHLSDCHLRSFYVVKLGTAHTDNNIPARGLQGEVKFE